MLEQFIPTESCHVVNIDADFKDQKMLFYILDDNDQNIVRISWFNFPDEPTTIDFKDFKGTLFPDIFTTRFVLSPYHADLKQRMNKIRQNLIDYVYNNGKVLLSEFQSKLISLTAFNEDEANAIIKLELARALNLKYLDQQTGAFIALSDLRDVHENKKRFLGSITSELQANSDRIDLLIEHSQTKGNFREHLLRNVLRKYIPQKYHVATGFIEGCKRQCDIIIYDAINYSPFFKEEELVVVPAKSVRAVIEVKTGIDANTLTEGLALLDDVVRLRNYPAPFFKGIFAFRTSYREAISIAEVINKYYNRIDKLSKMPNEIMTLYQPIDAITILNSFSLQTDLFDYHRIDRTIRPRIYSVTSDQSDINIAGSSFFSKLFSYLDVEGYAKMDNSHYFEVLDYHTLYKLEAEITTADWQPRMRFSNEHDGTTNGIVKRVADVVNWQQGKLSHSELESKYFDRQRALFDFEKYFEK